tara:strand:+ start:1060 stop:1227 length:168 start_codon:yes stop_codon:yes gene_type:complete
MNDYLYCGKCGSEMKPKGLAKEAGLCEYCYAKWFRHEITWVRGQFRCNSDVRGEE